MQMRFQKGILKKLCFAWSLDRDCEKKKLYHTLTHLLIWKMNPDPAESFI